MKRILSLLLFLLLWMSVPSVASIESDSFEPLLEEECEFFQAERITDSPAGISVRFHRNRIRPILPEIPFPSVCSYLMVSDRHLFADKISSLQRSYIGKRYLYCVYRV